MDVQVGKEYITCTRDASRLKALLLVRYTPSDIVLLILVHPECMLYLYTEAQHFSTVHKYAVNVADHNNICLKVTYLHSRFVSDFTVLYILLV